MFCTDWRYTLPAHCPTRSSWSFIMQWQKVFICVILMYSHRFKCKNKITTQKLGIEYNRLDFVEHYTSLFTWLMDQLTIQTRPTSCRAYNEIKLKQPVLLVTLHHRPLMTNFRLFFHSKGKYCTINCLNELIFIKSNLAVLLWYIISLYLPLRCMSWF